MRLKYGLSTNSTQKNKMDSRFYKSLQYCKYFNFSMKGIGLNINYKDYEKLYGLLEKA